MKNYYLEAAGRVSDLADKFSDNNDLANVLRAGSSKITKLAGERGVLLKNASVESEAETSVYPDNT